MRHHVGGFFLVVFTLIFGLVAFNIWKDLGLRREIWHKVTVGDAR